MVGLVPAGMALGPHGTRALASKEIALSATGEFGLLASLVVTPALVSLFGKRVTAVTEEAAALGKTVLVPVWGDSTRPALALAGKLATSDGGIVLAASFARTESSPAEQAEQRGLTTEAEGWLAKEGLESRTLFRVAATVPEGLLETILGEKATLLINEWHARDPLASAPRGTHG